MNTHLIFCHVKWQAVSRPQNHAGALAYVSVREHQRKVFCFLHVFAKLLENYVDGYMEEEEKKRVREKIWENTRMRAGVRVCMHACLHTCVHACTCVLCAVCACVGLFIQSLTEVLWNFLSLFDPFDRFRGWEASRLWPEVVTGR